MYMYIYFSCNNVGFLFPATRKKDVEQIREQHRDKIPVRYGDD